MALFSVVVTASSVASSLSSNLIGGGSAGLGFSLLSCYFKNFSKYIRQINCKYLKE